MTLPDFKGPLHLEITFAEQLTAAASRMLPDKTGRGERLDLAAALAHVGIEHIIAFLALFRASAFASGYALMRPATESIYRSVWIATVADDTKVSRAYRGRDAFGTLKSVITDIEREYADTGGWSTVFGRMRPHLRSLHERTHSGAEQTLRRLRDGDLRSPPYDFGELLRDVRTAGALAMLGTVPLVDDVHAGKLNELMLTNYSWLENTASTPPTQENGNEQ